MEILYRSKKLRKVCTEANIGRCYLLTGNRAGQYAMDLAHPYRLVFIKIGQEIQIARIQEIIDYHR